MIGSLIVYAGLLTLLPGLVSAARPLRFLGIPTRKRAALLILIGSSIATLGVLLPAPETRVAERKTRLDEFSPVYQFHEVHAIRVKASPERVFEAVRQVTAQEIRLFRALTWIRRLGRRGPEDILRAPEKQPLIDVAIRTSFLLLAEAPARELVVGTLVMAPPGFQATDRRDPEAFKALTRPGFAKATMNFLIEADGANACRLTTETRVHATDAASRLRFAAYWRIIHPGSALIRRMWLHAIRQRAEGGAFGNPGPRRRLGTG